MMEENIKAWQIEKLTDLRPTREQNDAMSMAETFGSAGKVPDEHELKRLYFRAVKLAEAIPEAETEWPSANPMETIASASKNQEKVADVSA